MKYTFTLAPGADPAQIRLAHRGASKVQVNEQGRLDVQTPMGGFAEEKPYVYQEIDGRRVEVAAAFEPDAEVFGFRLGDYDRTHPLVLDPAVLVYSGFIGDSGVDDAQKMAVDYMGNSYLLNFA